MREGPPPVPGAGSSGDLGPFGCGKKGLRGLVTAGVPCKVPPLAPRQLRVEPQVPPVGAAKPSIERPSPPLPSPLSSWEA